MLCSCQLSGAFLFFGVAVRAAYSIGVHRAEILLITECVVLEVYSRRKISLQLTEGISRQLRDWSVRWLPLLKDIMAGRDTPSAAASSSPPSAGGGGGAQAVGACQVLASYYYAVMLVSRPFLMYELCRRLSDCSSSSAPRRPPAVTPAAVSGKSKLADACIDAASLMVDSILDLIGKGLLNVRVPLMVSWLFASSLVLGVGLLGGFGRILEKYSRMSIQCLDHFAKTDGHAAQYSLIAQSLLATALEHLERQELEERLRRTESSSQLFGLLMPPPPPPPTSTSHYAATPSAPTSHESALHLSARDAHSAASSPVPSASTRLGTRGVASPASTPSFIPPSYPLSRTRDLPGGGAAAFDRDKGRRGRRAGHRGGRRLGAESIPPARGRRRHRPGTLLLGGGLEKAVV
ncbi:hypothetical protein HIM_05175 [Hirsutella minnesotensis 3608]|uniref:Uncharacterized protein n=1 Tax=Hirsutella minnesotensis 3608 TaxID=1043627 RepID=A0A0F8A5K3_9HYPO|nr:hypothetical protein HIM_05175 [Hirsutella minnesotensis 3608]